MKIKKIISILGAALMCVSLMSSCGKTDKQEETSSIITMPDPDYSAWKDKYEEYLMSIINGTDKISEHEFEIEECRFGLADINGGEVPELLISEGNYQASKVEIICWDGYEIKTVGAAGAYGEFKFVDGTGIIYIHDESEEQATDTICRLDGTTLNTEWEAACFKDENEDGVLKYFIDNEETDLDTYTAQCTEKIPTECSEFGRGGALLTAENIMAVIESGTLLTGVSDKTDEDVSVFDDTVKQAYRDALKALLEDEETPDTLKCAVAYIDDNDIPELVIAASDDESEKAYVYTYQDGAVILLGSYGNAGEIKYVEKQGTFFSLAEKDGTVSVSVYSVSNGECENIWTGASEGVSGTYYIGEEKVDKDEYDVRYAENVPVDFLTAGFAEGIEVTAQTVETALTFFD